MANQANKYVLREYVLDTNNFGEPKIVGDKEAMALLLTRLLLLEPGTNPLFPEMGVGLVSHYRFLAHSDETEIRKRIEDQVETYFPDAKMQEVNFTYNDDKTVNIEMMIDDMVYVYDSSLLVPLTLKDISEHSMED